jgi:hypothetical protein
MAQKILLRRGGIENIGSTIAVSKGELLYASGSISGVEHVVFVANADGNNTFTPVNKLYTGTAAANSFSSQLNGTPYYKSDSQALHILNSGGSSALDLSGNLEGTQISSITASGSFSGSFVGNGSGLTNISLGSLTAPGNDTEVLFNNNGSIGASSNLTITTTALNAAALNITTTGDISGSNLKLTGNANIAGNVVIGGNITIGDTGTDFINFAGEISSSLIPDGDNEFDLGSDDRHWRTVFSNLFSGSASSIANVGIVRALTISGSNLNVAANATVGSTLTAADVQATNVYIDSGVGALKMGPSGTETFVVESNSGNTRLAGTLNVTGSAIFGSTLRVATGISSSGWLHAAGDLDVEGNSILTGNSTVGGTLGVTGHTTLTTVSASSYVSASDTIIAGWGSVSASLASIQAGTSALSLDDVTNVGSTTANSIQVGGLTVTGNLTVQGTTTTIDSTEVNVGDRIITLNTAGTAADGGIQVIDPVSTAGTGSLLWSATNDYWYAGVSGSTHYRLSTYNGATPTTNVLQKVNASGRLVDSAITDNGSTVVSTLPLTGAGLLDSTSTAAIRFSYINASKQFAYITPTTAGDLIQWDGAAMVATNVIDGGTF